MSAAVAAAAGRAVHAGVRVVTRTAAAVVNGRVGCVRSNASRDAFCTFAPDNGGVFVTRDLWIEIDISKFH